MSVLVAFASSQAGSFAGGSGTEDDPYLVETAAQLDSIRYFPSSSFLQAADIVFDDSDYEEGGTYYNEGLGWQPVGSVTQKFTGNYNGAGFKISNLRVMRPDSEGVGLFGYLNNAEIDSVVLVQAMVLGYTNIGTLAGYTMGCTQITDCRASGKVYATEPGDASGGLVGALILSTLNRTSSTALVMNQQSVGGLVGYAENSDIQNSFATGDVTGSANLGGLVGYALKGEISFCYSTGDVIRQDSLNYDNSYIGAFIGGMSGTDLGYSYCTGNVNPGDGVAASNFVGSDYKTFGDVYVTGRVEGGSGSFLISTDNGLSYSANAFARCYWDTVTSGFGTDSVGNSWFYASRQLWSWAYDPDTISPFPRSTEEMKTQSTFDGWDFDTTWAISENETYPALRGVEDNAPFGFKDSITGSLSDFLNNDYDYESGQANLIMQVDSAVSLVSGTDFTENAASAEPGDSLYVVYRVGEVRKAKEDTLWGNRVISYLFIQDTASKDTSGSLVAFSASGNPGFEFQVSDGSLLLHCTLPQSASVSFSVHDMQGRRLSSMDQGEQPAGEHSFVLNQAFPGSGIYLVSFKMNGQLAGTRLAVNN